MQVGLLKLLVLSGAEDCYTSELSVNISANMDGQTVVCIQEIML